MKKILRLVYLFLTTILLVMGCNSKDIRDFNIEERTLKETVWNMEYIQGKDGDVIYCANKNKNIYPDADIKNIICTLQQSSVKIMDKDTGEEHIGKLKKIGEEIYEVIFDNNESGYISKSYTEYNDRTKVDTLIISCEKYSLNLTLN